MGAPPAAQAETLREAICRTLRANPGVADALYECMLALWLSLHPEPCGLRQMAATSNLSHRLLLERILPEQGQTSAYGLIVCRDRGAPCYGEEEARPGHYAAIADCPDTDHEWRRVLDPGFDVWANRNDWAIGALIGPQTATLRSGELTALLGGTRTLTAAVMARFAEKGLGLRRWGRITLVLDQLSQDPYWQRADAANARLQAKLRTDVLYRTSITQRFLHRLKDVYESTYAGYRAAARWLGLTPQPFGEYLADRIQPDRVDPRLFRHPQHVRDLASIGWGL